MAVYSFYTICFGNIGHKPWGTTGAVSRGARK